jgi:hypothetical protein
MDDWNHLIFTSPASNISPIAIPSSIVALSIRTTLVRLSSLYPGGVLALVSEAVSASVYHNMFILSKAFLGGNEDTFAQTFLLRNIAGFISDQVHTQNHLDLRAVFHNMIDLLRFIPNLQAPN